MTTQIASLLDPLEHDRRRRGVVALLVAALLAALLVPGVPGLASRDASAYLVPRGIPLPADARVLQRVPIADALIVRTLAPPAGAARVDEPIGFRSLLDADVSGSRLDSGLATTGADAVWGDGNRGQGTVVALIDSGVAPIAALDGAVVGEIDFTGTGGGDPYGHGTFLASLIAGRGAVAPGVAPGAGILSLKVGGPDGTAYLGAVLSALQWLHGPGRSAGVRIAALAIGVEPGTPGATFLDTATQRLADTDVLLVTAAGNEGPGRLSSPATSTGTFSVGAVDDRGTRSREDDHPAAFSATGVDRAGVAQPDLVASGVGIVGSMSPTSRIARDHPQASVGGDLFRGTGTSMATALAAGVAALAQTARPDLGGSALQIALRNDAGILDARDAVLTVLEAPQHPAGGSPAGTGILPPASARGKGTADVPATHDAVRWTAVRWTAVRWTAVRWTAVRWTAVRWTGGGWGDASWDLARFGAVRWTADGWADATTDGDAAFQAVRWTAVRWTAARWS